MNRKRRTTNPNAVPVRFRRHPAAEWVELGSVGSAAAAEAWVLRLLPVLTARGGGRRRTDGMGVPVGGGRVSFVRFDTPKKRVTHGGHRQEAGGARGEG
jgi:hypothetical protein